MKDLILSPKHGINPTMPQSLCPVCAKRTYLNEIWLLGKLPQDKEAPRYIDAGLKVCKECQTNIDNGLKCLIVIDEAKSDVKGKSHIGINDAYRTGELLWMNKDAFDRFFPDADSNCAYVDQKIAIILKEQFKEKS